MRRCGVARGPLPRHRRRHGARRAGARVAGRVRLLQLLAAWSWLRWRALINALTGKRRSEGRKISAWLGLVLTIVLGLVSLAWAVGLSVGAWFAGRSIAGGDVGGPGMIGIRVAGGI